MGWDERRQGRECLGCGARSGLFVIHYSRWVEAVWDWTTGRRERRIVRNARAFCADVAACRARQDKATERSRQRGGLIVIFDPPCADPPAGACQWCGEPIALTADAGPRRARRTRHRGDEFEQPGSPDCLREFNLSRTWQARVAVERRDLKLRGVVACADCGIVCQGDGHPHTPWEADHEVPLEDGGAHELANLAARCVPCHRTKTARENAARRRLRA